MFKIINAAVIFLLLTAGFGFADGPNPNDWSPSNGETNDKNLVPLLNSLGLGIPSDLLLVPHLKNIGGGLDLGIPVPTLVPGQKALFWADGSLALENQSYLRDGSGTPIAEPTAQQLGQAKSWTGVLNGELGLEQVLWTDETKKENRLGVFGYARIRGDLRNPGPDSLFANSPAPDRKGNARGSALGGGYYDQVSSQSFSHVKRGVAAETSLEGSPAVLSTSRTEFYRINFTATGFLPLATLSEAGRHLVSFYAAERISIDDALSGPLPIDVGQSLGGRHPFGGMGGAIRGVPNGAWDVPFKAVANTELRIVGPGLGTEKVYPDFALFADTGYYADGKSLSGLLGSVGAVAAVHLFLYDVGAQVAWRLDSCPADQKFTASLALGTSF